MTTRVENIYKYPEGPDTAYIGRKGKGRQGYFGNPFPLVVEKDRQFVLEQYKKYFYLRVENDPEFWYQVMSLKGKILLCFCAPKACHGDIIADWIDSNIKESN